MVHLLVESLVSGHDRRSLHDFDAFLLGDLIGGRGWDAAPLASKDSNAVLLEGDLGAIDWSSGG